MQFKASKTIQCNLQQHVYHLVFEIKNLNLKAFFIID